MADLHDFVSRTYGIDAGQIEKFGCGIINETYAVVAETDSYIMQQMHGMFPPLIMDDFKAVTEHLQAAGWTVPQIIPTIDGKLCQAGEGEDWWRLMTFIASDTTRPSPLDPALYIVIGGLLGRWHRDIKTLDYQPRYSIPHFHETDYYRAQLEQRLSGLAAFGVMALATDIIAAYDALPELPESTPQLIHGDPQTSNILFRDGQPLTLIDFDTIMRGPIWLDIGDMLRSLAEDVVEQGGGLPLADITSVVSGYYEQAGLTLTRQAFYNAALVALQQIALELGMRFLIDLVDDNYFSYDIERFNSRQESNKHRAQTQWQIYALCQERLHD